MVQVARREGDHERDLGARAPPLALLSALALEELHRAFDRGRVVFYLGRERQFPTVGQWTVGVHGPSVAFPWAPPLELVVRDGAFPSGRNMAAESESLYPSKLNRDRYCGSTDLSFTAVGPHPRYTLTIGGEEMRSGDLQAESAR